MSKISAAAMLVLMSGVIHPSITSAQPNTEASVARMETVQITATRFGEPIQEVPMSISIVTGESIRARGATDLRTALALLGGVSVAPGGDAGPASAVPGLLGLREVDDFLLLIDGIPAGGAFVPPFEAIVLNNVERIEVLRGAAPVYFGTTAFAGTVNVIHYEAGKANSGLTLRYGSWGSVGVSGAAVLSNSDLKQSVSGQITRNQTSDPRARFGQAQASYRLATELGHGQARLDINLQFLRQKPTSPTPVDDFGQLRSKPAVDFNQNPTDAKLNSDRYQGVLAYDISVPLGRWGTTLSLTQTRINSVRGFLVEDYPDAPGDNALGYRQSRLLRDLYFDTHITDRPLPYLDLTYGLNQLSGRATQDSHSATYNVPLSGGLMPALSDGTPSTSVSLTDKRSFFGLYTQSRLKLSDNASLLGGLRWNYTHEDRYAVDDGGMAALATSQRNSRLSGSFGGQLRVWQDNLNLLDDLVLHASVGNTFQPPQIDFGPEAGFGPLLRPETQRSLQLGAKADALGGKFDLDLSVFMVDFDNQPVTTQIAGLPILAAGGSQRFKGITVESAWRPISGWSVAAHASVSDAHYRDFSTSINGAQTQLSGKQLVMSSRLRAGGGLVYAPNFGWRGSLTSTFTGPRYMDKLNTVKVDGFNLLDASVGYRFDHMTLTLSAANLSNRRDPILPSELGETQFYRMTARHFEALLTLPIQ